MTLNGVLLAVALAAGSSSSVSVKYDGPLKEAIRQIAESGGLNVVIASDLTEQVQVHLTDVAPEEALQTLGRVYDLQLTHEGKLWVIKRGGADLAAIPPIPPVPPRPPVAPGHGLNLPDPDEIREAADRAREQADEARDRAQEIRDQAQEVADARREEVEARMEEVRARAEEARARSDAERDVVATGGPMVVKSNTRVESAIAYGGPVIVESNAVVEGDAVAFGADVVLQDNAVVEGDAVSFGGRVIKEGNAKVHGEVVSMGSAGFGHSIADKVVKHQVEKKKDIEEQKASSPGASVGSFFAFFAVLFGLGFVLMMFAPQRMKLVESSIRAEPVKNGIVGFLALIALLPVSVVLFFTFIGWPVLALLWVTMALSIPIGLAVVGNSVGSLIPTGRLRRTQALVLAIGVLLMVVVWQIPVVGVIVWALAAMIALGAMVTTRLGQPPRGLAMPESTFTTTVA